MAKETRRVRGKWLFLLARNKILRRPINALELIEGETFMPKYVIEREIPNTGQFDHGSGGGDFAELLQCAEESRTADSVG